MHIASVLNQRRSMPQLEPGDHAVFEHFVLTV